MFSEPLFFDDGKNRVLGKMCPLSLRELTALWQWNIPFVMTAGETVKQDAGKTKKHTPAQPLPQLPNTAENVLLQRRNKQPEEPIAADLLQLPDVLNRSTCYTQYAAIITAVDVFLHDVKAHNPLQPHPLDEIAARLRTITASDRTRIISFAVSAQIPDKDKAKALVDTAVLAETIAYSMQLPESYVNDIVLASLLHDCGMLTISDTLLNKKEALSETELRTIAAHTVSGYKTVISECMYTERIARLVLQHHERWDGKGYPNKLEGDSIEIGARIIAVVDAFTAMTHQRAYRNAVLGYEAVKTLLADKGRRFDYNVVKALVRSIGLYPLGSLVLLNNTALARVVAIPPETPLRPLIRILIDENGQMYRNDKGNLIDLKEYKDILIIKAIDPLHYQSNSPEAKLPRQTYPKS